MSNEERNSTAGRDPEATVVKPFFNEASEETARPVVPLAPPAVGHEARASVVVPVPSYADSRARRSSVWPVALVGISLLTGLVVGIAGLRLYQRTRATDAQPAATEQTSDATRDAGQETTTTAPVEQQAEPVAAAPEPSTPAVEDEGANVALGEEDERPETSTETRRADDEPSRRGRESTEAQQTQPPQQRAPREEERPEPDERRARRERDDDDDESAREIRPQRPGEVYDTQGSIDEVSAAAARRAEREEQRLRRAERQRRREDRRQRRQARREEQAVDSVRGIFEGQPPE